MRFIKNLPRIELQPSFLCLCAVIAASGYGPQLVALLICVTFHEAAHIAAGLFFGLRTERVRFTPVGEAAVIAGVEYLPPMKRAAVLLAGPSANFALAALAHCLLISDDFAAANVIIGAFNLLPALPLDGGRLLAHALDNACGMAAGAAAARRMTGLLGLALMAAGLVQTVLFPFNVSLLLAGFYITLYKKRLRNGGENWFYRAASQKNARRRLMPVKSVRAPRDMGLVDALRALTWDYYHIFYIEHGDGQGLLRAGESAIIAYALENGLNGTLEDAILKA